MKRLLDQFKSPGKNPPVLPPVPQDQETSQVTQEPISIYDPGTGEDITVSGNLITNIGGQEIGDSLRQLCLLTDNGHFLVSRSHRDNHLVLSLEAKAKALGFQIGEPHLVDFATLKLVTEAFARRRSLVARGSGKDETRMQRELIEWFARAAKQNASDIHFIVNQSSALIRMRIDGGILEVDQLQIQHAYDLLATGFAMCDSSDASYQFYEYQGARISDLTTELPVGVQAVRMQWNPLAYNGRYLIARMLYSGRRDVSDLDVLGYSPGHLRLIKFMRSQPLGMVIISGPTGSGKSTTLKKSLENLMIERNKEINVLTVEDPPEYIIEGAQQMPVTNAKTPEERAIKFQQAINAALRSDPDVIMIGEVRDAESGKLAFEGAMTGHQIWTSLHTNSAIGILDRLCDMLGKQESYKIFDPSILNGLVGQRLLRKLCPHCRIPLRQAITERKIDSMVVERLVSTMEKLGRTDEIFCSGPGCEFCNKGYIGRTVAAEVIVPDEHFMDLLRAEKKTEARKYWLEDMGGATMLAHGLNKVFAGMVSPADLEKSVGTIKYENFMRRIFCDGDDNMVALAEQG